MKKPRCPACRSPVGDSRGADRVRLTLSPVIIRMAPNGQQTIEGVCRSCHNDVSIPLPLPPEFFGVDRVTAPGVASPVATETSAAT